MSDDTTKATYDTAVRSFDHAALANLPAYHRLREALDAIAHEAKDVSLSDFLEAVQDMALTTPYGDTCDCASADSSYLPTWPHKVDRDGDWLNCAYRCGRCGCEWTCGYSVNVMHWM